MCKRARCEYWLHQHSPSVLVKATYASVSEFIHNGNETLQLPWATNGVAILEVNAIVMKEALVTVGMRLHTHAINTQFVVWP